MGVELEQTFPAAGDITGAGTKDGRGKQVLARSCVEVQLQDIDALKPK